MFRWAGKLAVVTGASSGIGAAIVKDLVKQSVNVVAVARRVEKIQVNNSYGMDRWIGRVAVVTGASSGIGAAISKDLAKEGVIVVALARRLELLQAIADEVKNEKGKVYPVKADLTNEADIVAAFNWVESNLKQPVHVLVNNAGVSVLRNTIDGRMDEWKTMFDTNVFAVGTCIREQLKSMKKHNVNDGHIVNICSSEMGAADSCKAIATGFTRS